MRKRWLVVGLGGLATATLGVGAALAGGSQQADDTDREPTFDTVEVERRTLVVRSAVTGEVGYGPDRPVPFQATGIVTWLPEDGSTVRRGDVLLKVDDRPVALMYGETPAYRAIGPTAAAGRVSTDDGGRAALSSSDSSDSSDSSESGEPGRAALPEQPRGTSGSVPRYPSGTDVAQLEANLSALGYAGFTVDEEFTAGTESAVRAWQRDHGFPVTGTVALGDVVFASGPLRAVVDPEALGTAHVEGAVRATSTKKSVTVTGPSGSLRWATKGARVRVLLPGQVRAKGTVGRSGPASPESDEQTVSVVLDDPSLARALGEATVSYAAQRVEEALVVPVTALVALAEGGYAVQLPSGQYVPVTPGLYAEGLVEVTPAGDLVEGARVRTGT